MEIENSPESEAAARAAEEALEAQEAPEPEREAEQGLAAVADAGAIGEAAQAEMIRKERRANNAWHKFCRNRAAVVGLVVVAAMIGVAVFAPFLTPYGPNDINIMDAYLAPGAVGFFGDVHYLGTDDLGRDIMTRLMYGARLSLLVAAGSTVVGSIVGILIGLLAGFVGGALDSVLMRIMDGMFAFPFILLAILLVTVLGSGSTLNVILAIGISNVPSFARLVRGQVIVAKSEEYCNAERVLGASSARIMFSHILPNVFNEAVVYATLNIGSAIIAESSLSFLGLGILVPTASWGTVLQTGRDCMTTCPWIAISAGLCIFVTVIAFNLVGDGVRDVLDPKMKR